MIERRQKEGKHPSLRDFVPKFYRGGPIRFYLPLLYDLVAINKPGLIVSIGFDEGEAHFTFCQAAQEQELKCRCVAIHRDDSGNQTDDQAWQKGKAYGEEFYGAATQFLSGSPIQLAEDFAKQDVDLLLISDCDSGSTIRQELAAWKTRLAPDAIVLMHGTELEREDAPKDAWSEFITRKPHMELGDGVGLGLAAATSSSKSKRFFTQLGESMELYRLAAEKIDAQARAAQIVRENTALEMRQIWLDSVLADRWKAQQIMDHQARELMDLEGKF